MAKCLRVVVPTGLVMQSVRPLDVQVIELNCLGCEESH